MKTIKQTTSGGRVFSWTEFYQELRRLASEIRQAQAQQLAADSPEPDPKPEAASDERE